MRIIIIGGEAAGMSAAAKAKRTNKELNIVVYEKTNIISFGACGLPYYVGNFFEDRNYMVSRTAEEMIDTGIDLKISHEVISVDTKNKKLMVKDLNTSKVFEDYYDKLMIATGASTKYPPIENLQLENVFTLKVMSDGISLKEVVLNKDYKNVVIIGAGFIGVETAHAMHEMGKNVTIIEYDKNILSTVFDNEISEVLEDELRNKNITLKVSEKVISLVGEKYVKEVVTDKGTYKADIVVMATGFTPNTEFLENTDIDLSKGAVKIDKQGKTNIDDIYSAGDCALVYNFVKDSYDYIPLATTANKMGRIVGENIAGGNVSFQGSLASACIKVMEQGAGRTGITEQDAKKLKIPYKVALVKDKDHSNYYTGQEEILVKLIYNANTNVILGGQIVGKSGSVLRVDVIASAIFNKMTMKELSMLDLCYSPPYARPWDVLNITGSVAK